MRVSEEISDDTKSPCFVSCDGLIRPVDNFQPSPIFGRDHYDLVVLLFSRHLRCVKVSSIKEAEESTSLTFRRQADLFVFHK